VRSFIILLSFEEINIIFIYALFNDTVSISDYMKSSGRMINE
jgi:hypothetical protein